MKCGHLTVLRHTRAYAFCLFGHLFCPSSASGNPCFPFRSARAFAPYSSQPSRAYSLDILLALLWDKFYIQVSFSADKGEIASLSWCASPSIFYIKIRVPSLQAWSGPGTVLRDLCAFSVLVFVLLLRQDLYLAI